MKTGTNPFCKIGATVVGKPAAQVMTSSPANSLFFSGIFELVRADNASKLAEEPDVSPQETQPTPFQTILPLGLG